MILVIALGLAEGALGSQRWPSSSLMLPAHTRPELPSSFTVYGHLLFVSWGCKAIRSGYHKKEVWYVHVNVKQFPAEVLGISGHENQLC